MTQATQVIEGLKPPRQDRSRDSLERILEASEQLLLLKGHEGLTVGEIISRAGVSRGTFCYRFRDKSALVHALQERIHGREEAEARARVGAVDWDALSLPDAIRTLLEIEHSAYGGYLLQHQAFSVFASVDPVVKTRGYRYKRTMEELEVRVLGRKAAEVGHEDPLLAARVLSRLWQGLRDEEVEWSCCRASGEEALSDAVLIDQLVRLSVSYLMSGPGEAHWTSAKDSHPRC
jgi:AcrR family transcriptional regulator